MVKWFRKAENVKDLDRQRDGQTCIRTNVWLKVIRIVRFSFHFRWARKPQFEVLERISKTVSSGCYENLNKAQLFTRLFFVYFIFQVNIFTLYKYVQYCFWFVDQFTLQVFWICIYTKVFKIQISYLNYTTFILFSS